MQRDQRSSVETRVMRRTVLVSAASVCIAIQSLGAFGQDAPRSRPENDLLARVTRLTGPAPLECGRHTAVQDWQQPGYALNDLQRSLDCVWQAAGARRPFWMVVRQLGIDSWFATGVLGGEDGVIRRFHYDSYPPVRFDVEPCTTPAIHAYSDRRGSLSCGEP